VYLEEGFCDEPLNLLSTHGERVGTTDNVMSVAWEPPLEEESPHSWMGTRERAVSAALEPPQLG
jgi:hypothetical protein